MITKRIKNNQKRIALQDGSILSGWGFNYAEVDLLSKTDEELENVFAAIKSREANFARIFLQAGPDSMSYNGDYRGDSNSTAETRTLPVGFAGANFDQLWYMFDVWTQRAPANKNITLISKSSSSATFTANNHGFLVNDVIRVSGVAGSGAGASKLNGVFTITSKTANTFTVTTGDASSIGTISLFGVVGKQSEQLANIANKLDGLLELAYDNGIERIRFPIYWDKIVQADKPADNASPVYNWTYLDIFIEKAADWGIDLFPQLMNAPSWATLPDSYWGNIGNGVVTVFGPIARSISQWNDYLAKRQSSCAGMRAPVSTYFSQFATVIANRYGNGNVNNASFWASKIQTVSVVSDLSSARRLKIVDGDTSSFKVGYKICEEDSGTSIPSGARITRIIDEETFLIDKPIPSSLSITAEISPPRITNWQIWNEPDLTGDDRDGEYLEVWADWITDDSGTSMTSSVIAQNTTVTNSSVPGNGTKKVVRIPVNLGKNWPQYPKKVYQIDSTGKVTLDENPKYQKYSWASNLVPISKAAKNAIKKSDPTAKVAFASLTSSKPTEVDTSKTPHPSLATWHKIDLIYGAGGKGAFDSLGYNLYTSDYSLYFDESRGSSSSIRSLSAFGIPSDFSAKSWRISVVNVSLFKPGDYAELVDGSGKAVEIVKIVSAYPSSANPNSLKVERGQLGTKAVDFSTSFDLRVYRPGLTKYLKFIHGSSKPPSISLTEWGHDTEPTGGSGYPAGSSTIDASEYTNQIFANRTRWGIDSACVTFLISKNPIASDGGPPRGLKIESQVGDTTGSTPNKYQWYGLIKMDGSASGGIWVPNGNFTAKAALTNYGNAIYSSQSILVADPSSYVENVTIRDEHLDDLVRVLDAAARNDIYVAICGLGIQQRIKSCHPLMDWYNLVKHEYRWAAQAKYWRAVAERVKHHPAVAYYNLMNEPSAPNTISFSNGSGTGTFTKSGNSIYASGSAIPTGTRVIVYDDNHFEYGIIGAVGSNRNVTQNVLSGKVTLAFSNVDFADWSNTVNVTLSNAKNGTWFGNLEISNWNGGTVYTSGNTVHKDNRYFMVKQGQTTTAGDEPKDQLSKWYELNVLGYEAGSETSWLAAWWSQDLTLTPKPLSGTLTSWRQSYRDEWFSTIEAEIREVDQHTAITSGGLLDEAPSVIKPYSTDLALVHAYPKSNFATAEFEQNEVVKGYSNGGPVVIEESGVDIWADSRRFENNTGSFVQGGASAYQDLNIFRAANAPYTSAFIAQDTSAWDDPSNSDDSWDRALTDFKNMSRYFSSGETRLILPHNHVKYLPEAHTTFTWKTTREPFTGSVIRKSGAAIFAANANEYFDINGDLQELDTSEYGSYVSSGIAAPISKVPFANTLIDGNWLEPQFNLTSSCFSYQSSWGTNSGFDDWTISGGQFVVNKSNQSYVLSRNDTINPTYLQFDKPIKNAFSASVNVSLSGEGFSGFIVGDDSYAVLLDVQGDPLQAALHVFDSNGDPVDDLSLSNDLLGGTVKLTLEYSNSVMKALVYSGSTSVGQLIVNGVTTLDGKLSVAVNGAVGTSDFSLTTKPRLWFYADIEKDTVNLVPRTPNLTSTSTTWSGKIATSYEESPIRYRVTNSSGSELYSEWPRLANDKSGSSNRWFLYAHRDGFGTSVSSSIDTPHSIDKGNVLNVVSSKNNYEIVSGKAALRGGPDNLSTETAMAGCYPFGSWDGVIESNPADYLYIKNTGNSNLSGTNIIEIDFDLRSNYSLASSFWNVIFLKNDPVEEIDIWALVSLPTWTSSTKPIKLELLVDQDPYGDSESFAPSALFKLDGSFASGAKRLVLKTDTMSGASASNPYQGFFAYTQGGTWSAGSYAANSIVAKTGTNAGWYVSNSSATSSDVPGIHGRTATTDGAQLVAGRSFTVTNATNVAVGNLAINSTYIPAGAVVTAVNGNEVTISASTTSAMPDDQTVTFGAWTPIPDLKKFFHDAVRKTLPPFGELLIGSEVVSYSNFRVSMPVSTKTTYTATNFPSSWLDVANYRFHVFVEGRGAVNTVMPTTAHATNTAVKVCKQWIKVRYSDVGMVKSKFDKSTQLDAAKLGLRISGSAAPGAGLLSGSSGSVTTDFSGKVGSSAWTNSLKIFRIGGDLRCAHASPQLKVEEFSGYIAQASRSFEAGTKGWQYIDLNTSSFTSIKFIRPPAASSTLFPTLSPINVRPGNVKIAGMFMEFMPSADPSYKRGKLISF